MRQPGRRRPVVTAARVAESLLRRCSSRLRAPVVDVGRGVLMHTDLDTPHGLSLFRYGLSAPELGLVERLLERGDVFVDGGAHVGTYSLTAARAVGPTGRVIAFEPTMHIARSLQSNGSLNDFSWLEVRVCALADRVGCEQFTVFHADRSGLNSFAPDDMGAGRVETVDVTTLDAAVDHDRIGVIKLDVEGSEVKVLEGGHRVLAQSRPHLLIEVEPGHLKRQGASSDEIDEILFHHGYTIWELVPGFSLRLRQLSRSEERSGSSNVFATTAPALVEDAGFELTSLRQAPGGRGDDVVGGAD